MKKKFVAGVSVVVLAASMFGFAHVFAGGNGQDSGGETQKEMKNAPKIETVEKVMEKEIEKSTKPALLELVDGIEEETTTKMVYGDTYEREVEVTFNDEGEKIAKVEGAPSVNIDEYKKKYKESIKNVKEKLSKFFAEQSESFSELADYSKWKQTSYDEGFNYYLKVQEFYESWNDASINITGESESLQNDFRNIGHMKAIINHNQFSRTSHLGRQGQAKEDVERSDQWKETPEEMRQAYEYMKQIVHDLDVAFNHDGEGETYGVTYTLNGDKASKVESLFNGK
ncbi:hypothetical protein SAMN05216238_107132 [Lentibacillus persicus]|uniref:Uncharacterized protein n=1 Tax=Lentibacillus persicus TaxID=640948 RepID=A0A1I1XCV3_9BACI|nr:hypothetical protein [Lentibacillus persicus]SFE03190.1 hypothetical protein SAMN05216238_107132 [Lentibacillus persicus]